MIGGSKTPFSFLSEILENRWVKLIVFLGILGLLFSFLSLIWPILKLFIIALVFAYLFDPVVDRLEKLRLSRTAAVGVLVFLLVLLLVGFFALLIPLLTSSFETFIGALPKYTEKVKMWAIPLLERVNAMGTLDDWAARAMTHRNTITQILNKIYEPFFTTMKGAFSGIGGLIAALLNVVIVPVAWFYLLRDFDRITAAVLEIFPTGRRKKIIEYAREIDAVIANFMRGQITVCLILGVIYALGLQFVAGVPLGLLIGLAAGLLSIVPYLGLIIGIGPALVLALLEYGDWWHPTLVVIVFAVAQALEGNLITPKIVGSKLGLHPVTVIFAILIFGNLLGLTGMLVAVPLTAILQVFGKKAFQWYKTGEFYRFGDIDSD